MKRSNRLSRAARAAKSKREQAQRRKEREERFPKPQLVPAEDEASEPETDDTERKTSPRDMVPLALLARPGREASDWLKRAPPSRPGLHEI